jgi:DNA-binding Xre family transcriptional regulator
MVMEDSAAETARIMASLKRLMRSRAMTYAGLAQRIGLSEASVKRIFSRATLTLARLDQICQALDTSIQEITRLAGDQVAESSESLTIRQEEALAADPNLLACFYLVASGREGSEIVAELGADERKVRRWYVQLQALGLIEMRSGLRARARTTTAIKWREHGPVSRLYARQVRQEFLQSPFSGAIEALHFRSSELSEASCRVLMRKLERLATEFRDLAELDRGLPSRDKRSMGLLLATRPWVFSMFESLRRAEP